MQSSDVLQWAEVEKGLEKFIFSCCKFLSSFYVTVGFTLQPQEQSWKEWFKGKETKF